MNRSFWNKVVSARGRALAVAAAVAVGATLLFVVCKDNSTTPTPTDPCAGLTVAQPGSACCVDKPTFNGCQVDPSCPPAQQGCPGYVPPSTDKKYCYWAPNQYNDYSGACVEIGNQYCTEASCQTEAGCTGASGVVKTTSNCDGLPITGEPPPQGNSKYCYWAPNQYNNCTGACVEIGGQYCTEASCQTEAGCTGASGVIKTTSTCDGLPLTDNTCTSGGGGEHQLTGTYCYWGPNGSNPASCEPIGGPYCKGSTCTEALCTADYGTVITSCDNPPTTNFCDYGPPVIVGGETVGGCWSTTNATCSEGGTLVSVCPEYPPPTAGGYCDYGFGNCIPSSQAQCNEYGAYTTQCPAASGKYCDFGQPTEYGNGGCYFRPSVSVCDEWSTEVSMSACIQSNTTNSTISNPCSPGGGSWTCP